MSEELKITGALERAPPAPHGVEILRRSLAFALHVPAEKILWRLKLAGKRRLSRPSSLPHPRPVSMTKRPPEALFAPRASGAVRTLDGWRIRILNVWRSFGRNIDWRLAGEAQLPAMTLNYLEFTEGLSPRDLNDLLEDWLDHAQPWRTGAHRDIWNAYAASLRAVVLAQQIPHLDPGEGMKQRVADSLAVHACYIEQNLELDLGGNHLLKNIKALLWASAALDGADVERWRETGIALLGRELRVQILPDGVHAERSISYHLQVLADLLEVRHALGSDPFGGELDSCIARMAQAAHDLAHPDGTPALFNDGGVSMAYPPAACLRAFEKVYGFDAPARRACFGFEEAGYFGCASAGDVLICDFGPIGPDDLPGHGHSDIGSFEWSVSGRRIIVDQGVFEYVEGPRRRLSKAAAAHNTLAIEGQDQADFFGAFRCGRRPRILSRSFTPLAAGFVLTGTHDGWIRAPGSPIHERTIRSEARSVEITDRLSCDPGLRVFVSFLLHPAAAVARREDFLEIIVGEVRVALETSQPFEVEQASWWPDLGREESTQRIIVWIRDATQPCQVRLRVIET